MVYPEITVDELKQKIAQKTKIVILDVRNPNELTYGKIPGYKQIPLPELEKRYTELKKSDEHIVYCRSGGRSSKACEFLTKKGYQAVNLKGGILAWKKYDPNVVEY